ncbi:heme/hemin ABC transporter substrate-binding protein [Paraburkholderia phenazinium]|jgi:iron complex transport system substrate-binding protein|uniref:Iron complex transport system substrate-binding protein n=1 Tax=Paraburkholderia phenazinium TaxID=60549 RepID=A0A1G8KRK0_9BURK|nr:ABC transporter substrate-binding protein [Paraburkholderia phenazinium]SDI46095.1 iron complex transport system substrate-binding protein [Paraburkholderia phenazinium]
MTPGRVNGARRAFVFGSGALLLAGMSLRANALSGPRRVIVVGGALAEIVYALDAQANARGVLVATDTTCTFPAAAGALPKVGYQRALSAEGLLSLRPDLILASSEAGPPNVLSQVKQAGVEVVTFAERHDVDSVREKIAGIARTLDASEAGKALQTRFDDQWQAARKAVDTSPLTTRPQAPRVLFVLNNAGNQAFVAGQRTAADAMLAYAGARNAMQGFNGYRPLSAEALVSAAPDIVLTTDEGLSAMGGADKLFSSPGFGATPAGRAKRVASLDTLFMLGFGPRLPAAVTALNQRLTQV